MCLVLNHHGRIKPVRTAYLQGEQVFLNLVLAFPVIWYAVFPG